MKKSNGKAAAIVVSGFGENEALRAEIQSGQVSEGAEGVQWGGAEIFICSFVAALKFLDVDQMTRFPPRHSTVIRYQSGQFLSSKKCAKPWVFLSVAPSPLSSTGFRTI